MAKEDNKGIKAWIKRKLGNITIGQFNAWTWVLLFALSLSAVISVFEYGILSEAAVQTLGIMGYVSLGLHIVLPLILIVLNVVVIIVFKRAKNKATKKLEELIKGRDEDWEKDPDKYINKLRMGDLLQMGVLRAGSTAALTAAIFMDRIRGLGYATAFSRDDLQDKILTNEIFACLKNLETEDKFHTMLKSKKAWPPSDDLLDIISIAATMPTKLWIDKETDEKLNPRGLNDLDYLVVCGQATICYNLMEYLWEELREEDGTWIDPNTEGLFKSTLVEWKKLMAEPLCLLMERKNKSRLGKLKDHAAEWKAKYA